MGEGESWVTPQRASGVREVKNWIGKDESVSHERSSPQDLCGQAGPGDGGKARWPGVARGHCTGQRPVDPGWSEPNLIHPESFFSCARVKERPWAESMSQTAVQIFLQAPTLPASCLSVPRALLGLFHLSIYLSWDKQRSPSFPIPGHLPAPLGPWGAPQPSKSMTPTQVLFPGGSWPGCVTAYTRHVTGYKLSSCVGDQLGWGGDVRVLQRAETTVCPQWVATVIHAMGSVQGFPQDPATSCHSELLHGPLSSLDTEGSGLLLSHTSFLWARDSQRWLNPSQTQPLDKQSK